jgi:CBS domain-containing protein
VTLLRPVTSVAAYRDADHHTLQQRLAVREIMTPRAQFLCALGRESVRQAFTGVPDAIDALPVVEGSDRSAPAARFVGVIDRRRVMDLSRSVASAMDEDAEPIGVDQPILDFITDHRNERLRLVSDAGGAIVGLVTIHDLARLPVRIAVFAVLTDLEEIVGEIIEAKGGEAVGWERFLIAQQTRLRNDLRDAIQQAGSRNGSGRAVLEMGLGLKLALLEGMRRQRLLGTCRLDELHGVRDLRNDIAHGRPFRNVAMLPPATRTALKLREDLVALLRQPNGAPR